MKPNTQLGLLYLCVNAKDVLSRRTLLQLSFLAIFAILLMGIAACDSSSNPNRAAIIDQCDDLAADPTDPQRRGAGVEDDALQVQRAIEACTSAVAIDTNSPRLRFQLGRALSVGAQYDAALEALSVAADARYQPAMRYIGDAYSSGVGLPEGQRPDPQTALQWYEKSAAGGSYPEGVRKLKEWFDAAIER